MQESDEVEIVRAFRDGPREYAIGEKVSVSSEYADALVEDGLAVFATSSGAL